VRKFKLKTIKELKKRGLVQGVDFIALKDAKGSTTKLLPGRDLLNKNSWSDVIRWCRLYDVKPSDVFNWVSKTKNPPSRTTRETNKIAILIYDKLQINEKKKYPLSERNVILRLREDIIKILPRKKKILTDLQLYRVGKKALERATHFLLFDKDERKKFGY